MSQFSIFNRVTLIVGLASAAATLLVPQGASAFGLRGGGFGGSHGGGAVHASFGRGGGSPGSFGHFNGMHLSGGLRNPIGRGPIVSRFPRGPLLTDGRPWRFPPIHIRVPPPRRWPPIFVPPYHHGPVLPPPIIVRGPLPIYHAAVGGSEIAAPTPAPTYRAYAPAPVGCGQDGSFISVVFVPTVTAADITAFLKAYNVTMADGPNADGIYRIRLSTSVMPQNEIVKVIDSMRSQTAIVSSVEGA